MNNIIDPKIKYICAKLNKDKTKWLPLWIHAKDAGNVMVKLVDEWLPISVIEAIGLSKEDLRSIAWQLGYFHDFGKATSFFQYTITKGVDTLIEKLSNVGLCIDGSYINHKKHAYLSETILNMFVEEGRIQSEIAEIIGSHHGKSEDEDTDFYIAIDSYSRCFYGKKECKKNWIEVWNNFFAGGIRSANLKNVDIPSYGKVILSGLLIMADWIASNEVFFPLIDIEDTDINGEYEERLNAGWHKVKLTNGWEAEALSEGRFESLFGFNANAVQQAMMDVVSNMRHPGLIILEAQMGVGKTEAALIGSEVLANKFHCNGLFFGLPSQATSNGIFFRLADWANKESEKVATSIRLAHNAALYNEEYQDMIHKSEARVNEMENTTGVEVNEWFDGNKKALLADFVVGTVDQFLMASLKRKHFMLRHLGLAGKVVIIDECHAYDTYMNQYLDQTIRWMAAYGVPVILLSATLPQERRKELIQAYNNEYCYFRGIHVNGDDAWVHKNGYPIITWCDGGMIYQKEVALNVEKKIVNIESIEDIGLLEQYLNCKLQDGGCVAIILNTVNKAQQVYEILKNSKILLNKHLILDHSRFLAEDRNTKDDEIRNALGKNSNEKVRNGVILIGTQVLEQSLDYDVDIMISELCPIDLLLQRLGRLHRHKNHVRSEMLNVPILCILKDDGKSYSRASVAVYGDYLLMKSEKVLRESINIPDDIAYLVQKVYDREDDCGVEDPLFVNAKEKFEQYQNELKNSAQVYLLERPDLMDNLKGMLVNDDIQKDIEAECSVRHGMDSLEVLLMMKKGNEYFTLGNEDQILNQQAMLQGNALMQKIRLPRSLVLKSHINKTIQCLNMMKDNLPEIWSRQMQIINQYVLVLDENYQCFLGNYIVSYSKELGLSIRKQENYGEEI